MASLDLRSSIGLTNLNDDSFDLRRSPSLLYLFHVFRDIKWDLGVISERKLTMQC